jgi:hypothetical protein
LSAKELNNMLYKYPSEGESCKEFVVSLRSFLALKRELKLQEPIFHLQNTDEALAMNLELDPQLFNSFVENIMF